jgi:hypothetical protein
MWTVVAAEKERWADRSTRGVAPKIVSAKRTRESPDTSTAPHVASIACNTTLLLRIALGRVLGEPASAAVWSSAAVELTIPLPVALLEKPLHNQQGNGVMLNAGVHMMKNQEVA